MNSLNSNVKLKQVEKSIENAYKQIDICTENFTKLEVDANFIVIKEVIGGIEYLTEKNISDNAVMIINQAGLIDDKNTIKELKILSNPIVNKTINYSFISTNNQNVIIELTEVGNINPLLQEVTLCSEGINTSSIAVSNCAGYYTLRLRRNLDVEYRLIYIE